MSSEAAFSEEFPLPSGSEGLLVAGIDEAGRGPLAGPVTAACVVLPENYSNGLINDSKKLSPSLRKKLFPQICQDALAWSIVSVGQRRIDRINIREATRLAMGLAADKVAEQIRQLNRTGIHCLVDGNTEMISKLSQQTVVKGDSRVMSIAAASVLAKERRDQLMQDLEQKYPGYGLGGHKGYPTKKHREAIKAIGPSRVHRKSFAGVKEFV